MGKLKSFVDGGWKRGGEHVKGEGRERRRGEVSEQREEKR